MPFNSCKSRGVVVVPFWPSSLFWPYLIQGHGVYKTFVVAFLFVQNGGGILCIGQTKRLVLAPLHLVLPCCF